MISSCSSDQLRDREREREDKVLLNSSLSIIQQGRLEDAKNRKSQAHLVDVLMYVLNH